MASFFKSVAAEKRNAEWNAWRSAWMNEKYKLHPDMSFFDVNVKYASEVNVAGIEAGVYPTCRKKVPKTPSH